MKLLEKIYFITVVIILCVTGGAKLISATGNALILENSDKILFISNRHVLIIVGILELGVATVLSRKRGIGNSLLALSLSTGFLSYRFGKWYLNVQQDCPCLGALTAAIHLSGRRANNLSLAILIYILVGSAFFLVLHLIENQSIARAERLRTNGLNIAVAESRAAKSNL